MKLTKQFLIYSAKQTLGNSLILSKNWLTNGHWAIRFDQIENRMLLDTKEKLYVFTDLKINIQKMTSLTWYIYQKSGQHKNLSFPIDTGTEFDYIRISN